VATISDYLQGKRVHKVKITDTLAGRKTFYRLFFTDPNAYKAFNLLPVDPKRTVLSR
jgi:hypothetical protein